MNRLDTSRDDVSQAPRGGRRSSRWTPLVYALVLLGSTTPALASGGAVPRAEPWIGTWATAPQAFIPGRLETFDNQTLRLIVHTSAGGTRARIKISNTFGDHPLLIGGAHIGRRTAAADIDPASDRALAFGGRSVVTIPAGAMAMSDPVELDVPALADLAVSLFLPGATAATTSHLLALQTSYVSSAPGDFTAAAAFPAARTIDTWPFLTGVDVAAEAEGAAIVAFGSSTTDGDGSTSDANRRWPDVLAERLQNGRGPRLGVLNQGIIGNRLLSDSPSETRARFGEALGQAGLTRFERDVLAQAGVRYVVLAMGVNDIVFPGSFTPSSEMLGANSLIAGYRQVIERAHANGIRVIGTTIPPLESAIFPAPAVVGHTPEKEQLRQRLNAWIRSGAAFDAVVDFDEVLRDPSHPTRLLPAYDSGDHLHANDAGYVASGKAIPLALFEGR